MGYWNHDVEIVDDGVLIKQQLDKYYEYRDFLIKKYGDNYISKMTDVEAEKLGILEFAPYIYI